MKLNKIFLLGGVLTLLASCNSSTSVLKQQLEYSLLMPSGAPTLPLYFEILQNKENFEIKTQLTSIPQQLTVGNYDFIVFDSTNATNILDNQENAKYEFLMMLTGGSFHLIGFDKEESDVPTSDDYIVSFMEGGSADLLFKAIYNVDCDLYFDNISALQTNLLTLGNDYLLNNETLDWAIISEPQLNNLKNAWNSNGLSSNNLVDINLAPKFRETYPSYEFDYIPQAALYVSKEYKENHQSDLEVFIERMDISVENVINHPSDVASTIEEVYQESIDQESDFGFNTTTMVQVQSNNRNGFGVVPSSVNKQLNTNVVRSYLSLIQNANQ